MGVCSEPSPDPPADRVSGAPTLLVCSCSCLSLGLRDQDLLEAPRGILAPAARRAPPGLSLGVWGAHRPGQPRAPSHHFLLRHSLAAPGGLPAPPRGPQISLPLSPGGPPSPGPENQALLLLGGPVN